MKKETKTNYPDGALKHKKPGMELKLVNGRYYLYGVKCIYDKTAKKSRKVSLGLLGRVAEEERFIPSGKNELKKKSGKTYLDEQVMVFEYGFTEWLVDELERNGQMDALKEHFPEHWKFIVFMVYCRIAYKSPLKNIPFCLEQSTILDLLGWEGKVHEHKVSDMLFELGGMQQSSIYYRMLPGNIREVSDMRNTISISATEECVFIATKDSSRSPT